MMEIDPPPAHSPRDAAIAAIQANYLRGAYDRGEYDPRWRACWKQRREINALLIQIGTLSDDAVFALNWHEFRPENSEAEAAAPLSALRLAMEQLFAEPTAPPDLDTPPLP